MSHFKIYFQLKQKIDDLVAEVNHYTNLPSPVDMDAVEKNHKTSMDKQADTVRNEERVRYEEKTMELLNEEKAKYEQELTNEIVQIRSEALNKFEEAKKQLATEQSDLINSMKICHKEELSNLEIEHEKTLKDIETRHTDYIKEVKRECSAQLDRLASSSESDMANQVKALQDEVSKLQDELSDAETILTNKEAALDELEQQNAEIVKQLQEEVGEIKDKHANEIENILKEHTEQMQILAERFQLDSEKSQETVIENYIEEIQSLKQSLTDAKCEFSEQIDILSEKLEGSRKENELLFSEAERKDCALEELNEKLTELEKGGEDAHEVDTKLRTAVDELQEELETERSNGLSLSKQLDAVNSKIEMGKNLNKTGCQFCNEKSSPKPQKY